MAESETSSGAPRPRTARPRLGEALVASNRITPDQLEEALAAQRADPGRRLGEVLVARRWITEEDLARALAQQHGLPFAPLERSPAPEVARLIPDHIAERHQMIPLAQANGRLTLAMADPGNILALDDVSLMTGLRVEVVVATPASIARAIRECYPLGDDYPGLMGDMVVPEFAYRGEPPPWVPTRQDARDAFFSALERAFMVRASELVLEPGPRALRVLLRLGTYLCPAREVQVALGPLLAEEVCERFGLDVAPEAAPTTSLIPVKFDGVETQVRARCLPGPAGPRIQLVLGPVPDLASRMATVLPGRAGLELFVGPEPRDREAPLGYELEHLAHRSLGLCGLGGPPALEKRPLQAFLARPGAGGPALALEAAIAQDPEVLVVDHPGLLPRAVDEARAGRLVLATVAAGSPGAALEALGRAGVRPGPLAGVLRAVHFQRFLPVLCRRCRVPARPAAALRELDAFAGSGPRGRRPDTHGRGAGCTRCRGTGYGSTVVVGRKLVVGEENRAVLAAGRYGAFGRQGQRAYAEEVRSFVTVGDVAAEDALAVLRQSR